MSNIDGLIKSLGTERVRLDEPLSQHTSLKVGGLADIFYEAKSSGELIKAFRLARGFGVPATLLGGGTNVVISDLGIRGLVVKNTGGKIDIQERKFLGFKSHKIIPASQKLSVITDLIGESNMADLNYDEAKFPDIEVVIESGVDLQTAIGKLLENGVTGLQWFARIPGTVGGAVYCNVHGGNHFLMEYVKQITLLNEHGGVEKVATKNLEFEKGIYKLLKPKGIILEITFNLKKGDVRKANSVVKEITKRKEHQPFNSAGYVFKNIMEEDRKILGYPTTATSYIIEHILNMSEYKIGGAMISPKHHNFIVNIGKATAKDYLAVRDEIYKRGKETIGVEFEDEIIQLGDFDY